MNYSVQTLAERLQALVVGNSELLVTGVAEIDSAQPGDLVFVLQPNKLEAALASLASVVVLSDKLSIPENYSKTFLQVKDPRSAMATALALWTLPLSFSRIHPTAVLGKNITLGKDVCIGPYCVVGDDVEIGDQTILYPNVIVYSKVKIGAQSILHSGAVIGADGFGFTREPGTVVKIPQVGTVILGDRVEIGASSAVDRATIGATVIGDESKLDNFVQIGHNCKIGRRCLIAAHCAIGGSTVLEDEVTIAGFVAVSDHITIGTRSIVGGRSCVIKDIPPDMMVSGYPAQEHRKEMKFWAKLRRMAEK
jgi:UDP-3-O-[3-hydroxymyristoyl] glucosamine N-acyltransferase